MISLRAVWWGRQVRGPERKGRQAHVLAAVLEQHLVDHSVDVIVVAPASDGVDARLHRLVEDLGRASHHGDLLVGLDEAGLFDDRRGVDEAGLGHRRTQRLVLLDGEEPAFLLNADALVAETHRGERPGGHTGRVLPVVDRHVAR